MVVEDHRSQPGKTLSVVIAIELDLQAGLGAVARSPPRDRIATSRTVLPAHVNIAG